MSNFWRTLFIGTAIFIVSGFFFGCASRPKTFFNGYDTGKYVKQKNGMNCTFVEGWYSPADNKVSRACWCEFKVPFTGFFVRPFILAQDKSCIEVVQYSKPGKSVKRVPEENLTL